MGSVWPLGGDIKEGKVVSQYRGLELGTLGWHTQAVVVVVVCVCIHFSLLLVSLKTAGRPNLSVQPNLWVGPRPLTHNTPGQRGHNSSTYITAR